jgi:Domain of unknown function (DUF4394)
MKLLYAACCVFTSLFICSGVAHAVPLLALGPSNRLLLIETSAPVATQIVAETQITGLQPGENLLAIDFRLSNGKLYGITDQSRLYTINTVTGAARQVGSGSFTPALNLGSGIEVGFDFNPVTDRIRVVTDFGGQNLRLNPDTGSVVAVDSTLAFAAGDPNAARSPRGSALGYSNNIPGATSTTLFNLVNGNMSASEQTILTTLGSPGGAPTSPNSGQLFTVGNTGVFNGPTGFDIAPDGIAYALFNGTDTWNQFFTVNLSTGAGTVLTIGQQMFQLRDLAAPLPNSVLPQPPLLVISQVYGNGGTAGAPFNASFVELFNRGVQNLALNQWSLRITSATGVFDSSTLFVSSGGIPVQAGQYVLVQVGSPGPNGNPLQSDFSVGPPPPPAPPITIGTAGKVALIKPGSNLSVPFNSCPLPNSGVADFLGFGSTATCFEGTGPAPTLNNTIAALRKNSGCTDNDINSFDFSTGPPTPRNNSSPLNRCNLADDLDFFARQHYLDFLNRQPDEAGLAFWKNTVLSCGEDAACAEVRRINLSAAFFLSIEHQESGYLVYRAYKAAYGNLPGMPVPLRFTEYLPDTQLIGRGLIVGLPGWQQILENNKVAFFQDFVTRSRFTNAFPTSMSPAEFVDALFANAGVTPSASDRNAAIGEFGGAGNTSDTAARARALRRVAENLTLRQQELNRAFVLMQYFGYLRRNPDDVGFNGLPDPNFDGFNFWLNKLNAFNGNFIQAEMVKAFISSIEYRQRFGP